MFGQFLLSTKIFWNKPTLGLGNVSGDPKLSACGGCRRFLGNIYYSVQIGTMNHVYEPLVTWDEYPQGMAQFHKLRKKLKKNPSEISPAVHEIGQKKMVCLETVLMLVEL